MNITPMPVILAQQTSAPARETGGAKAGGNSFGQVLNRAIEGLNSSQVKADVAAEKFLTGEIQDIHQVAVAMEEAKVMMQLAIEVRNKVVEAYQEISRMQV